MITLNGKPVKPTIFPDRTSQVWQLGKEYNVNEFRNFVEWRFESEAELFHLAQLKQLLDEGITVARAQSVLNIPYLPYARQDKTVANHLTFAFNTFTDVLNLQAWDEIYVFDPHNRKATEESIKNVRIVEPNFDFTDNYDLIIFPDFGASHRYPFAFKSITKKLTATKHRDETSGRIVSYKIEGFDPETMDKSKIIVIDDLCDGGATFEVLAQTINHWKMNHRPDLYVSHGLFSKGLDRLLSHYGKIITTHSILDDSDLETAAQQSTKYASILAAKNSGRLVFNDVTYHGKIGT